MGVTLLQQSLFLKVWEPESVPSVFQATGAMAGGGNDEVSSGSFPPTFHPTLAQLADWEGFVDTMEKAGAHKIGIAKLVMPEGWQPREGGYKLSNLGLKVGKLLTQRILPTKVRGSFVHEASSQCTRSNNMSVAKFLAMASSSQYQPPSGDFSELARKYWEQHYEPNCKPPVYGADIRASLMDPHLKIFNLDTLNSRPQAILSHDQGPRFGGVHDSYIFLGMWASTFSWHVEDQVPVMMDKRFTFSYIRTCMG